VTVAARMTCLAGSTAKWKFRVATRNRLLHCMNLMAAVEEECAGMIRRHPSVNAIVISSLEDGVKMRSTPVIPPL